MENIKTVDNSESSKNTDRQLSCVDPICSMQNEDVAQMRTSLLSCSASPATASQALKRVAALRIYHQIARIIKYTELMDKLEDKLYSAIEYTVDNSDDTDDSTWVKLITIQEKLQKNMIESQKLIQPMLDLDETVVAEWASAESSANAYDSVVLNATARERIRNSAQAVLLELKTNAG